MVFMTSVFVEHEVDALTTMKTLAVYLIDETELFYYLTRMKNFSAPKMPSSGTYRIRNLT